jgi:hypothetical protein
MSYTERNCLCLMFYTNCIIIVGRKVVGMFLREKETSIPSSSDPKHTFFSNAI